MLAHKFVKRSTGSVSDSSECMDGGAYVVKRDGRRQAIDFNKIKWRLEQCMEGLDHANVSLDDIIHTVESAVIPGITTEQIDVLVAETSAMKTVTHPDYGLLAARIAITNLHKETSSSYSEVCADMYNHVNPINNQHSPLIAGDLNDFVQANAVEIDAACDYDQDLTYTYFGFKTLERAYLTRINGKIVERPQHMIMRVCSAIHFPDMERIVESYKLMSEKWFTPGTPTLFNAGTCRPQMSSCFLVAMKDDSIEGIYDTLATCAKISKFSGGIGLHCHNIRSTGSYIAGTNGHSNGLLPMLRVFNDTARFVTQGGGKRNGSIAVYLEPWHPDIYDFLDLRKNTGKEEQRARDLFLGLWMNDLFMRRVRDDAEWSLLCPHECPGLSEAYGPAFDELYEKYEKDGKARTSFPARKLWTAICESQMETGTPYLVYKDAANLKSNQKNLGTIKCSNLCTEIIEYTAPDEVAVCNLASVALPKFVNVEDMTFDLQKLFEVTKVVTRNLNQVIDRNFYPVPEARNSNMRHRPVGLGVQGLADAFIMLRMPFESDQARQLNIDIFETIYFAAVTASMEEAKVHGPYQTYEGSPISKGIFQFDMWNVTPSPRWDWAELKADVLKHGVRNSLLVAPMPTASTAQILGNNEAFEPYTSQIYSRRVLAGEFQCVNRHLLKDLLRLGLWSEQMKNHIIADNGSIQHIDEIPKNIKDIYKTVWEIKQKRIIEMAADRAPFIDQSQSLNLHVSDPTFSKLTSMHFFAWEKGLKTGIYYLRSRAAADAIKFTVDRESIAKKTEKAVLKEVSNSEQKLNAPQVK